MNPTLSLVIPAYNEANRIRSSLEQLAKFSDENEFVKEVIIVVEKSSDETLKIVQDFVQHSGKLKCIANPDHFGKGFAVRTGMLAATGDYALFCDADLGVSLDQVPGAFQKIVLDDADLLIGNRFSKQGPKSKYENRVRSVLGWLYRNTILKWLRLGVDDSQCGFKMFRKERIAELFLGLKSNGFAFDVELLLHSRKSNLRFIEYPVVWINRPGSSLSVFKHGFSFCVEVLKLISKSAN